MRWILAVTLFLTFGWFPTSQAGDERLDRKQPVESLIKQLAARDPDKACAAAKAVGRLGPAAKDAVPALKNLLKDRNDRLRLAAAEALWRLQHQPSDLVPVYSELVTVANADVRAASAWRLGRFGSDARPAVLLLAGALRDEDLEVRVQAGQALANLGPYAEAALPALVRALGDQRLDSSGVARQEGWVSARSSPALPALIELADESIRLLIATFRERPTSRDNDDSAGPRSWEIASRVAHALPAFGARAIPPLVEALDAKDAQTRSYAATALRETAQFVALPEPAIVKLEKCLDDPEMTVRTAAARAMSWSQPSCTKAVAVLDEATKKAKIDSTKLLADLERMGPHSSAARDLLRPMLGDESKEVSREAYRILASFKLPADQVLETWTKALSHADPKVRSEAINALAALGSAARPALAELREGFGKQNEYDRKAAKVDAATDSAGYFTKWSIITALAAIDANDLELIPFLIKAMDDSDARHQVLWTMADLGPKAAGAIGGIAARLLRTKDDLNEDMRDGTYYRDLVKAITRIAPGSEHARSTLLKALRKPTIRSRHCLKNTFFVRDLLEDALQAYLPAAEPMLREALKDEDRAVRQSVALVLLRAGLDIEAALPILIDKLWDSEDTNGEHYRFQQHVVEVLMRRNPSTTPAVAEAWCNAWQAAGPNARGVLESGLLVVQPEALPHLLGQLKQAGTLKASRDLAHLLARFEGQGKQILPILLDELREPEFAQQYAAMKSLMELGPEGAEAAPLLGRLLDSPRPEARAAASKTLGSIGRAAQPAVAALRTRLTDSNPQIRLLAADALSRVDPSVSEALLILRDEFVHTDEASFRVLEGVRLPEGMTDHAIYAGLPSESIARFGEPAVAAMAELLDNTDLDEWSSDNLSAQCGANARVRAALLLARLGPEAKAAVPTLVRALKDKDPFVREAAASALGRIGPAARKAAPDLIALLEQQNRIAAGIGPWSTGPRTGSRFGAVSSKAYGEAFDFRRAGRRGHSGEFGFGYARRDPYAGIRRTSGHDPTFVLSQIDTDSRSALPLLREMAKDAGHPGRLAAALAVWRCGSPSPELIPAFTGALGAHARTVKNERRAMSSEMRACLAELGTQLKPALPAMTSWLKEGRLYADQDDRVAVAEAIGGFGADASAAAPLLRSLIDGDGWYNKERVASALGLFRISGEKELVFPVLVEVLSGPEERLSIYYVPDMARTARVNAAHALGVLAESGNTKARGLVLELAKGDVNPHVRLAALEALARRKPSDANAPHGLTAMLRHPDAEVRFSAAAACGRLGQRAKVCRPALKAATEDSELAVRQAARQALQFFD